MTLEDWATISEIVGATATVATLIYLIVELRANTRAHQVSSIQYMLDGARDRIITPNIGNEEVANIMARGLASPESLTPTERVRFLWILTEHVLQLQNVLNLWRQGDLSEFDYQTWLAYVGSFVRAPGGKEFWPECSKVVSQDVAEALNEHLAKEPSLPSLIELWPTLDARRWPTETPPNKSLDPDT